MFDRLIDVLTEIVLRLTCLRIVPQYEGGVVLRCGRYHRDAVPGLVWHWPLFESVLVTTVIPSTERTQPQTVQAHGQSYTVSLAVTWRVTDPRRYLLEIHEGETAVVDCLAALTGELVSRYDGGSVLPLARALRTRANRRAKQWGIRFDRVQFADFARALPVRVIAD